MIETGQVAPDARVYRAPGDTTSVAQLLTEGPVLLVFYLFDWSST